jgi:DNA-binding beta-propeller fold protein YncE
MLHKLAVALLLFCCWGQVCILSQDALADVNRSSGSREVLFDGSNIWVLSAFRGEVIKVRASDGAVLGKYRTGMFPIAIAFDGSNIWVSNHDSQDVTKLRATDGKLLGSFHVGPLPVGVACATTDVWVANSGDVSNNRGHTVTRLRASDGSNLGSFEVNGLNPFSMAFDGAYIWVGVNGGVTKLRVADGTNIGTFKTGGADAPLALTIVGTNIWAISAGRGVVRLRASDGANLGTFKAGTAPYGAIFDGANVWLTDSYPSRRPLLSKLRASDGAVLATYAVGQEWLEGLAYDGTNIWVLDHTGNLIKLRAADGIQLASINVQ